MSATRETIAATLRGRAAVDEVRTLLTQLVDVDADLERVDQLLVVDACAEKPRTEWEVAAGIHVTHDELRHLIQRRRDAIVNKLQNKGIRIAPDPDLVTHSHPTEDAKASV
ncbi:hypothetical protein ACO2Q2_17420 [Dyella sp. KRB-257]|uniref:hypothetical protein n=1 Tax=Dyella sp. KRB-257 TaxID=3400915 RepID=UPI003C02D34B